MEQENSNQKENYSLIKVNDGAIVQAYSNQNKEEKAKELSDQLASQDKETDSEKQVDFVFVEEEKNTGSYLVVSNNDLTTIEKDNKITNEQSFLPALIDEEVSLHVVDNSNKNEIENKQLFFSKIDEDRRDLSLVVFKNRGFARNFMENYKRQQERFYDLSQGFIYTEKQLGIEKIERQQGIEFTKEDVERLRRGEFTNQEYSLSVKVGGMEIETVPVKFGVEKNGRGDFGLTAYRVEKELNFEKDQVAKSLTPEYVDELKKYGHTVEPVEMLNENGLQEKFVLSVSEETNTVHRKALSSFDKDDIMLRSKKDLEKYNINLTKEETDKLLKGKMVPKQDINVPGKEKKHTAILKLDASTNSLKIVKGSLAVQKEHEIFKSKSKELSR